MIASFHSAESCVHGIKLCISSSTCMIAQALSTSLWARMEEQTVASDGNACIMVMNGCTASLFMYVQLLVVEDSWKEMSQCLLCTFEPFNGLKIFYLHSLYLWFRSER